MASKLGRWFKTDIGKNVKGVLAFGASLGAFATYMIPQGLCLDQLKQWVCMYSHGFPTPIDPDVEKRALEVLDMCDIKSDFKKNVDFFTVYGIEVFSAGSLMSRWGAIIGLPSTFSYKSIKDVKRPTIQLRNVQEIDWASPAGKQFQESMVVSENAQKFVVAREIYFCKYPTCQVYGLMAAFTVSLTYSISSWGNKKGKLLEKSKTLRYILYSLTLSFGMAAFFALKDAITLYWESKSDEKAAKLGEEFLQGGLEYYQNLQYRNIALRTLMGSNGESSFTAGGNENLGLLRTPSMPISARIELLKQLKEKS